MNNFITLYLTTLLFIIFFWGKPQNIVSFSILLKYPGGWKTEREPVHSRKETGQREVCNVWTSATLMSAAMFSSSFYVHPVHQLLPFCLPQVNLTPPLLVSDLAPFFLSSPGNDAGFSILGCSDGGDSDGYYGQQTSHSLALGLPKGPLLEMGDLILLSPGL